MHGLFNILVRRLRFFCINHINIVIFKDLSRIPLHFVGIKDKNQCILFKSLIIAQNIHQRIAGAGNIDFRQASQLIPGKDNVVAVNQQIAFFLLSLPVCSPPSPELPSAAILCVSPARRSAQKSAPTLYLPPALTPSFRRRNYLRFLIGLLPLNDPFPPGIPVQISKNFPSAYIPSPYPRVH